MERRVSNHEVMLRMAVGYRRRAEALERAEQRARYFALAEYWDQMAAEMEYPPGIAVRVGQAISRYLRTRLVQNGH